MAIYIVLFGNFDIKLLKASNDDYFWTTHVQKMCSMVMHSGSAVTVSQHTRSIVTCTCIAQNTVESQVLQSTKDLQFLVCDDSPPPTSPPPLPTSSSPPLMTTPSPPTTVHPPATSPALLPTSPAQSSSTGIVSAVIAQLYTTMRFHVSTTAKEPKELLSSQSINPSMASCHRHVCGYSVAEIIKYTCCFQVAPSD